MVLPELHESFVLDANKIGDWQKMSKLSIAKGFVEHEQDIPVRDSYFSAFALRYWHEIPTLYKECEFLVKRLHLSLEDVASWYFEALLDVFKYRAFMNPEVFNYVKDGNEDKFINGYVYRAIDSTRERKFQYYNYDKRKLNMLSDSLDTIIEEKGDSLLVDDTNHREEYSQIDELIRKLISNNEIYEALLVYACIYGDSFSKTYEDGVAVAKYIPRKATNLISELTEKEIDDFIDKYGGSGNKEDISYELYKFRFYSPKWISIIYENALEKLKNCQDIKDLCKRS